MGAAEPLVIDFTPPFRRIPIQEGLEEALGVKLPGACAGLALSPRLNPRCSSSS